MGQWPRDDRREAAAVVPVERTALSGVAGLRISREDAGYLRHCTVVPRRMRYHVARQKSDAAAINAVRHPVDGQCHLLLHLTFPGDEVRHKDLLLANMDDEVLLQDIAAAHVLLTVPPAIDTSSPNNVQNDPRWVDIVGGGLRTSARRRRQYGGGRGINRLGGTNRLPLRMGVATQFAHPALQCIHEGARLANPGGTGSSSGHELVVVCVLWPP